MARKMAFILKGYPRISETFIAQEIYLLEQEGFEIEIFSMRAAREPERQPIVSKIKASVTYIPEYLLPSWRAFLYQNFACFLQLPLRFLRVSVGALLKTIVMRSRSPWKRFLQAGWLIGKTNLHRTHIELLHAHFIHDPTELT